MRGHAATKRCSSRLYLHGGLRPPCGARGLGGQVAGAVWPQQRFRMGPPDGTDLRMWIVEKACLGRTVFGLVRGLGFLRVRVRIHKHV